MKKDPEIVEKYKNDDTKQEMAREVAEAIVANKLVLFIGAGFAMNLELPSWKKLVEILCNNVDLTDEQRIEVKDLVKYGYLSDALEKIAEFSSQQTHKDELRNETMIQFSQHHFERMGSDKIKNKSLAYKYLSELYKIGAKKIVTTNYDDSIEVCLDIKALDPAIFDKKDKVKIIEEDKYFIKLHGGVDSDMSSVVLFEEDYRKKYILDEQIPNLLQELFTHNRILFLGCGLFDKYMDIYERLKYKEAVMDSYVICTNDEHMNVSKRTGIKRIKIEDYCYLDVILEMILWEAKKAQREKCKKILFDDLSLKDYNYTSAKEFFDQVSDQNVRSCYFFNTQVEFSAWFSPALQLHLSQQMDAYFKHKQDKNKGKDNYEHCRILFLPFDKKDFHINLKSDNTYMQDVKAMVKIHEFMHCEIAFITTDVFKEIIEATCKNKSFFSKNTNLKLLGLNGLHADLNNLEQKIQKMNEDGYKKTNDLDFSVIKKTDNSTQIWQANYGQGPNKNNFIYSCIMDGDKKTVYEEFSGIIIDYLEKNKEELLNPTLKEGKLDVYLGLTDTKE